MKNLKTLFVATIVAIAVTVSASCKKEEPTNPIIVVTEDTPVTDYDGNTYKTVKIGEQIWMAENLKSTHYSDGSPITYFNYANNEANVDIYGRLYTWSSAMKGAASSNTNPGNVQGIAPDGWHLPSNAEWQQLVDYLGGKNVAGERMKEIGNTHWMSPNTATNESGFNALPGGLRHYDGSFGMLGEHASFWSSTLYSGRDAWAWDAYFSSKEAYQVDFSVATGFSIRCIKN